MLLRGDNDRKYLESLAEVLVRVAARRPLAVVVGGGPTARQYIDLGRDLGLNEVELDELGIAITRLHARLLAHLLGPDAPSSPPGTLTEAAEAVARWPIVVMGGTEPSHTTDAVASLLAERIHAGLIVNATNVKGFYAEDPRVNPRAPFVDHMGFAEFAEWVRVHTEGTAGQHFVFDALGARSVARSRIPLAVVDGRNLENLEAALEGQEFEGSWVGPGRKGRAPRKR